MEGSMKREILGDWFPEEQATTIDQMDSLIVKLKSARDSYDEAKKASAEKYHQLEEVEKEVMNTLKANGRTKFEAEGVASVSIQTKEVFTTPKTNEAKRLLFKYIQDKYGVDVCTSMLSINHNTLQGWANREIQEDASLRIPGLEDPTSVETLYFRSKK